MRAVKFENCGLWRADNRLVKFVEGGLDLAEAKHAGYLASASGSLNCVVGVTFKPAVKVPVYVSVTKLKRRKSTEHGPGTPLLLP